MFQSTHPLGCDGIIAPNWEGNWQFQSTHPYRVRHATGYNNRMSAGLFQSTHPLGCDEPCPPTDYLLGVSIHAPIRVRPPKQDIYLHYCKFQSTHPLGCDWLSRIALVPGRSFNPRTHIGCDISPSPAWARPPCFNPRTHIGCDSCARPFQKQKNGFNPRTHIGCDSPCLVLPCTVQCFNPRTHIGCDCIYLKYGYSNTLNTHFCELII